MISFTGLQNFDSGFKNMFGRAFDGDEEELKSILKRFLSMLFASPSEYTQEQSCFYSYFPTIHQLIKNLNSRNLRVFRGLKGTKGFHIYCFS